MSKTHLYKTSVTRLLHNPKISKKLTSCSVWIRAAHRQKKTTKTEAENDNKESRYALGTMAMAAITKD
jgi:hypothetical protein